MAGNQNQYDPQQAQQQYVEQPQGYYDENGNWVPTDGTEAAPPTGEEDMVVKSIPGFAIALVAHAILLLIAAFIVYVVEPPEELEPLDAELLNTEMPPLPDPPETDKKEVPEEEEVVENPVIDPQVEQVVEQNEAVDPTKDPLNPNPNDTPAESPNPNKNPNSSMGFGGGGGGAGGGAGGGGGLIGGRSGIVGKPNLDRVNAALQWLADHQAPDGSWSADKFLDHSIRIPKGAVATRNVDFNEFIPKEADTGWASANVGLTGLALLAFAGDGHTHEVGNFARTVKRGLQWTLRQQDAEGFFGEFGHDEAVYNHSICTMAIAEIYAMSQATLLKKAAQDATDWIIRAQNPGRGWRYGIQNGQNDSSVTAWMVLTLKSAKLANLKFPEEEVYAAANTWYDDIVGKNEEGYEVTGYKTKGLGAARLENAQQYHRGPSMDACNVMVRLFTGSKSKHITQMTNLILKDLPKWYDGEESKGPWKIDMYYWYYASLAMFQMGGGAWEKWESYLIGPTLLKFQRAWHEKDITAFGAEIKTPASEGDAAGRWRLDEHGSWDPVGAWGSAGGRVYSTAINALTLEVYYRYKQIGKE